MDSLNPTSGPTAGGNDVVLTGSGFTGATDVHVGSTDLTPCPSAPCFTFNDDTKITATMPPEAAGDFLVNVTTGSGTSGDQTYTYIAAPTLDSLNPTSGSTAGGNDVVLTGSGFTGATDVHVGSTDLAPCPSAPCFTFNDDTKITATMPAEATGDFLVNVTTGGGTSGDQTYTYVTPPPPPPTLASLNPTSGSTVGGNNVILTGSNFTGATDVHVGSTDLTACPSAPCFTFNSDTKITANMPAEAAGDFLVNVTTGGGTSGDQTYTYVTPPPPPPTLASLNPTSGSTAGGNNVVLTGSNFTGATDVHVGSTDLTACPSAPCFTFNSDTKITATMPAEGAGDFLVNVTTGSGTSGDQTYTYVTPGPTLTSLNPSFGSTLGGNSVILTGTNFTGSTHVHVGSTDLTSCGSAPCFTFNSDIQITVSMPPGGAGGVNVNVTTSGGTSTPNLTYTYVTPAPTLTSLSPTSGSTVGGNSVMLNGTNFTGATDVHVGSADLKACGSGSCFAINSDILITVTMPSSVPGPAIVNVTTPGGVTGNLTYTYVAPGPTVTHVTPNAGGPLGGNTVTLTGTDFEAAGSPIATAVTVGASSITANPCGTLPTTPCFTVNSATMITVQVLPSGSGMVNITVTTPGGTSPANSLNVYTYVTTIPAVTTVSPKFGAASGGAYVTIIGSNFGDPSQGFGATDVRFGTADTVPCPMGSTNACFVQIGTTTLDVYTPAVAAGTIDITVQTPGGNSQAALADRYTYVDKGAYTALSPFRICDTRKAGSGIAANQCDTGAGKGTLGPGGAITAQITASGGPVPLNAQAVVVNLTAIDHSSGSTYISAYPTGAQTFASNVNIAGGKAEANLAIVRLSSGGQITLFNGAGSADVIVDVEGYFTTPTGLSAGAFHSIPPLRICDSRGGAGNTTVCATATGRTSAPLVGGVWRHVTLSGLPPGASPTTLHIPTDNTAAAAVFNLTATAGTAPTTFLSVAVPTGSDACPTTAPSFSNLNPTRGISLPNRVISNLGPNQDICLYNALGSINFVIDVSGWFGKASAPAGAFFYSVPPTRICDTRPSDGTRCQNQPLSTNVSELIHVAGIVAVPASLPHATANTPVAVAVVANLTAVAGSAATYFTLYPSDANPKPTASDLNPSAGEVIANLAITSLAQTGSTTVGNANLYNAVGSINAVLDVAGWFQ